MPGIGSLVSALPILRVSRIAACCLLTRVRNATLGLLRIISTIIGIVSSVALRVGVPDISPHSLRRTFCTLSRDAGVPDRDIMAAGGWNSPQMLDYYDMSRRGLNGKAGDGLQDYLGKED